MRAAKAIAVYAAVVVIFGALCTPWIFRLVHPHLPEVPFRRVFDRVLLVCALAGLWPLLRSLGLRSWAEVGFARRRDWWRELLVGFGVGCASFVVGGIVLIALGQRSFELPEHGLAGTLMGALAAGLAVGIIEEMFFRGGWQGALQRGAPLPVAIGVTSAFYSAMHFLKPKGAGVRPEAVDWLSGFDYLGQVLTRSWQAPGVAVGFVTLLLAGCVLGLAFARTRALYLSIGIHAGWVFTLKSYAALTDATGPRTWWGGAALVDNVLVWPALLGVLAWVGWRCRP